MEEQLPSSSGRIDFIAVKSKYLSSNDYFAVVNQWYNTNEGGENGGFTSQRPAFLKAVRRVITRAMEIYVLYTDYTCNSQEDLQYALRTKFRRVNREVVEKVAAVIPVLSEVLEFDNVGVKLYYCSRKRLMRRMDELHKKGELPISSDDLEGPLNFAIMEDQAKAHMDWLRGEEEID